MDGDGARGLDHRYFISGIDVHRRQSHRSAGVQRIAVGRVDRTRDPKAKSSWNLAGKLAAGRVFCLLCPEYRLVRLPRCRVQTVDQVSGGRRHGPDHPDGPRSLRRHQACVGDNRLSPDPDFCIVHQVLPLVGPRICPMVLDALLYRRYHQQKRTGANFSAVGLRFSVALFDRVAQPTARGQEQAVASPSAPVWRWCSGCFGWPIR